MKVKSMLFAVIATMGCSAISYGEGFKDALLELLLVKGPAKQVDKVWDEEIALSNGQVIWVKRTASYFKEAKGITMDMGGRIKNIKFSISVSDSSIANPPPIWSVNYGAMPLLLDYDEKNRTWFIVAITMYCEGWAKWGKPDLPYGQYIVKDNQWRIVPLDEKLIGRITNMYTGVTNEDKKLDKITINEIKSYQKHYAPKNGITQIIKIKSLCSQ